MDDVARFPANDRAELFTITGTGHGLSSAIIEKDFWVCWTLKRVFSLPNPPAGLLFKGGTSLSKVFDVIDRFSEDIDLSFDRSALGFGGDKDPRQATSTTKRKQVLKELSEACRTVIAQQFLPQLIDAMQGALQQEPGEAWNLSLDGDDSNGETILFRYPTQEVAATGRQPAYIRPVVRLEMGARSDHWPAEEGAVTPYAAIEYPEVFREPSCQVHALSPQRTFWEKATILHTWYHAPHHKPLGPRQSRHYYDLMQLFQHDAGQAAIKDIELLHHVAKHKDTFFPAAWAKYQEATPGTLHLLPPQERWKELEQDYRKMQEMIFSEPPSFEEMMIIIGQIEEMINEQA